MPHFTNHQIPPRPMRHIPTLSLYREFLFWGVCPALPAQQYKLRLCSLPIKSLTELSGLMTFRSNAAERERDQLAPTHQLHIISPLLIKHEPTPSFKSRNKTSPMTEICEAVMKAVVPCDCITTICICEKWTPEPPFH